MMQCSKTWRMNVNTSAQVAGPAIGTAWPDWVLPTGALLLPGALTLLLPGAVAALGCLGVAVAAGIGAARLRQVEPIG